LLIPFGQLGLANLAPSFSQEASQGLRVCREHLPTTFAAPLTERYLIFDEIVLCKGCSKGSGGGEEER